MRYAMVSGHLAARALMEGRPENYDRFWRERFGDLLKLAVVNRVIFEKLGNAGRARLLRRIGKASDAGDWMGRHYGSGLIKKRLYPFARRRIAGRSELVTACMEGCDCTMCRCLKTGSGLDGHVPECHPQDGK